MTPSSGSGAAQSFAFTASSANGGANIKSVDVLLNWSLFGDNACYVRYVRDSTLDGRLGRHGLQ